MDYPPMISLIDVLHDLGENVTYIGDYTNSPTTARFQTYGIELIKLSCNKEGSLFNKFKTFISYKHKLSNLLPTLNINKDKDVIWYVYSESANFIYDILKNYRYVIHYYEYARQGNWKYKLLCPRYNQTDFAKNAIAIVQCEYNRAQIFRAINGLNKSPFIIPNKPYVKDDAIIDENMPDDIRALIGEVRGKTANKFVILYQGIFDSNERKLSEFCEAVMMMPSNYVMIAMGKGDKSYEQLKKRYNSDKIIFIPFIIPPYHLIITQLASIGVMSYSPHIRTHAGVVNSLYCAPNKIFEYGKFGKPMISNNIPGLKYIFNEYHCGELVDYPITPESIVKVLQKLFDDYNGYSKGAKQYFDSVDLIQIVRDILQKIS